MDGGQRFVPQCGTRPSTARLFVADTGNSDPGVQLLQPHPQFRHSTALRQPAHAIRLLLRAPGSQIGIAAGIYAGFGFFGLVGDPKRGIIEMDAALEAGAWKGISIGPISGEVKLAFGFRYTRTEASVADEGYICARGASACGSSKYRPYFTWASSAKTAMSKGNAL